MRIWSLHPKYLDGKGLVAVWREALLAKHVLRGKTRGYRSHPQLDRFKAAADPLDAINQYLAGIFLESVGRNYNFDKNKINWGFSKTRLTVTTGQLNYEAEHLVGKLKRRNKMEFDKTRTILMHESHPLFKVVAGDIEKWERVLV